MRKWEDIVKDKLEETEDALPEGVFAEFQARLEGVEATPKAKRFPLAWALVPAAGLAAIFILQQLSTPENSKQIIQQPANLVAVVSDSIEVVGPIQTKPLIAQTGTPIISRKPSARPQKPESIENPQLLEEAVTLNPAEDVSSPVTEDVTTSETKEEQIIDGPVVATTFPFVPDNVDHRTMKMKVAPAAGAIAGGGLLAAILTPILSSGNSTGVVLVGNGEPPYSWAPTEPTMDVPTGNHTHYFPLKGGLSVGIPVAERLKVTTGLEYCLYRSSITYTLSRERKQLVHYLGIPVRLDWTLANNRWLDLYLGGGIEGDYCIGATLAGQRIKRDGFGISLIGAGGIQINITKRIGFYVEPELSWTIPSEGHVLETYRSEYPFMFSVVTGLRINLCE